MHDSNLARKSETSPVPAAGTSFPLPAVGNASLGSGARSAFLDQNNAKSSVALAFRTGLTELAASYSLGPSSQKLSKMPDNSLLEVLRYVYPSDRTDFIRSLMFASIEQKKIEPFLCSKLNKMLYFTDAEEKSDLVRSLIDHSGSRTRVASEICHAILWSARSMRELCAIVKSVGRDNLLSFRNSEIREMIAHAEIGPLMRRVQLPAKLSSNSNKVIVLKRIGQIRESLNEALDLCKSIKGLARTGVAKNYARALKYDLAYLSQVKSRTRSVTELRNTANLVIEKSGLQLKYELLFSHEYKDGKPYKKWSEGELKDIKSVLNKLPEGKVLWTAKFFEIRRVTEIEDALAVRHCHGPIDISDDCIGDKSTSSKYKGKSSLSAVFAHEVCHALCDDRSDHLRGGTDFLYDLEDYLRISGWSGQRTGFRISPGEDSFTLDGDPRLYLFDAPINIDGKGYKFAYEETSKTLFRHDLFANFTPGSYCRTSPREDRSEAFTDYLLLPKRLLTLAPEKFLYFENQFRLHDRNSEIKDFIGREMKQYASPFRSSRRSGKTVISADRQEFLTGRFEMLTPVEQSIVIAELSLADTKADKAAKIFDALNIMKTLSRQARLNRFTELLAGNLDERELVSRVMLEQHREYLPALCEMIRLIERGEQVGLLTARGAREANAGLIEAIQKFTGYTIRPENIFFVGDADFTARFGDAPTPERKYQVLREFARTGFISGAGNADDMQAEGFDRVVLYDDEDRNLKHIKTRAAGDDPGGKVSCIDARKLSIDRIWKDLMNGPEKRSGAQVRRMNFFDIDGTLLRLETRMYITDRSTGRKLMELQHGDMARYPSKEYWIDRVAGDRPDIPRENLEFDMSDFHDPWLILKSIAEGMDGNRMFKKQEQPVAGGGSPFLQ